MSLHFQGMEGVFFWGWIALLLVSCVIRREVWPFYSYPMFSKYAAPEQVVVYSLELEFQNESSISWDPKFFYDQITFSNRFQGVWAGDAEKQLLLDSPERPLLNRVLQEIRNERPDLPAISALRIIRKVAECNGKDKLQIEQSMVLRVPVQDGTLIKPGRLA